MASAILQQYKILVEFLGKVLGPDYEIVLQDLSSNSIVAIANNQISGRSIGSPLTNTALQMLSSKSYEKSNYLCNYKGITKAAFFWHVILQSLFLYLLLLLQYALHKNSVPLEPDASQNNTTGISILTPHRFPFFNNFFEKIAKHFQKTSYQPPLLRCLSEEDSLQTMQILQEYPTSDQYPHHQNHFRMQ